MAMNVEEIAVFDDASQDDTYELAVGLKALRGLPKLHVLKHEKNLGYGGNQKAGYRYFIEKGFDVVVLLHGDGQYAPEILSHLYHPIVKGEAAIEPGVPESFNVLIRELQSLCLDVELMKKPREVADTALAAD